jgi:hypothetical protein
MSIRHRRRARIPQGIPAVSAYLLSGARIGLLPEAFCVGIHGHPSSHHCPLHLPLSLALMPHEIHFSI